MLENRFYFAYGANMNMDSMSWRCPNARPVGAFELRDWELEFYSHANIRPVTGSKVQGVLWSITEDCEQSLDAFEGFPDYYTKRSWIQDGRHIMFYEMADFKRGQPTLGYISDIRISYHYWHLPVQYLNEAVNATVKKTTTEYI
jgi:gamma-glutamylcyclotransferase